MTTEKLDELRNELSVRSKNGVDFTLAASIIWLIIAYIWTLKFNPYDKSIFVFIAGAPLLPMAFLFSKLLKTNYAYPFIKCMLHRICSATEQDEKYDYFNR